jgi:hypothetical protein
VGWFFAKSYTALIGAKELGSILTLNGKYLLYISQISKDSSCDTPSRSLEPTKIINSSISGFCLSASLTTSK